MLRTYRLHLRCCIKAYNPQGSAEEEVPRDLEQEDDPRESQERLSSDDLVWWVGQSPHTWLTPHPDNDVANDFTVLKDQEGGQAYPPAFLQCGIEVARLSLASPPPPGVPPVPADTLGPHLRQHAGRRRVL